MAEKFYTFTQFVRVILLLMLIIFVVAGFMITRYRNMQHEKNPYTGVAFLCLILLSVSGFLEEIAMTFSFALSMRLVQNVMYPSFLFLSVWCIRDFVNKEKSKTIMAKYPWILALFIVGIIFLLSQYANMGHRGFVSAYLPTKVQYHISYGILLMMGLGALVYLALFLWQSQKKSAHYKTGPVLFLLIFLWILPLCFYLFQVLKQNPHIMAMEWMLYFLNSIFMVLVVIGWIPYGITPVAFDNVRELIQSAIFVADSKGEILYQNHYGAAHPFFKGITHLGPLYGDISAIFLPRAVSQIQIHGLSVLLFREGENLHYFSYDEMPLGEKKGKMLIFSDMSGLIQILDQLVSESERLAELNHQLRDYAQVAYRLEKEKKIHDFMEEVQNTQKEDMTRLRAEIEKVLLLAEKEDREKAISKCISLADTHLRQVRAVVSAFHGNL